MREHRVEEPGQFLRRQLHTATLVSRELTYGGPLEVFRPYTSRRLHWFPFEITRCTALRDSIVSTRNIYGNYQYRTPFPQLPAVLPSGSTPASCSLCAGPLPSPGVIQVWISLWVATDVLPLLVHSCSQECFRALPKPANRYVSVPHVGGQWLIQPLGSLGRVVSPRQDRHTRDRPPGNRRIRRAQFTAPPSVGPELHLWLVGVGWSLEVGFEPTTCALRGGLTVSR